VVVMIESPQGVANADEIAATKGVDALLIGTNDLCFEMGIPGHKSDFGQTFGVWGIGEGPFITLPIFGPSNPRDAVGLAFSFVVPPGIRDALIGTVACSLALWGTGEAVSRVMGKDALGFGDVKMVAMMGAFLGWKLTLVSLFLASSLGSAIGLAIVAITRNREYMLPLGSFLAVGGLAAAAFGDPLVAWYAGHLLGR